MSLIFTFEYLWASWKDDARLLGSALGTLIALYLSAFIISTAASYKFSSGVLPSSLNLLYAEINFCVCVWVCWSDKLTAGKDLCCLWNFLKINETNLVSVVQFTLFQFQHKSYLMWNVNLQRNLRKVCGIFSNWS